MYRNLFEQDCIVTLVLNIVAHKASRSYQPREMDPIEGPLYVHLSINHTSTYVCSSNGPNIFLETDKHDGLSGKCPCFTTATNYITPRNVHLGHSCDTIISRPPKIPYHTWKYLLNSTLNSDSDFYSSISLSRLETNIGPRAFLLFPFIEIALYDIRSIIFINQSPLAQLNRHY